MLVALARLALPVSIASAADVGGVLFKMVVKRRRQTISAAQRQRATLAAGDKRRKISTSCCRTAHAETYLYVQHMRSRTLRILRTRHAPFASPQHVTLPLHSLVTGWDGRGFAVVVVCLGPLFARAYLLDAC